MSKYLFLFTIGPVQSFIERARKTQDLYAGSRLLSEMTRAGIVAFMEQFALNNPKVIFPSFDPNDREASVPNRFISSFDYDGLTEAIIHEKSNAMKLAVWKALEDRAKISVSKAAMTVSEAPDGFWQQLKAHMEMFWVCREVKEDYGKDYKVLESLLGSVKNVRPFEQFSYQGVGEKARKCSIDGVNNALFYRPSSNGGVPFWCIGKPINSFLLNPGEGLSAISFVKRFAYEKGFPATAQIALLRDEKRISETSDYKWFKCYQELFSKKDLPAACIELMTGKIIGNVNIKEISKDNQWNTDFDYQYLYEENLIEKNFPNREQLNLVRQVHKKLNEHFKQKYYALVIFDGDKMGEWLSGEKIANGQQLEAFHNDISKALANFGHYARTEILKKDLWNGETIYAGGDDFMGFINLECLFDTMQQLRGKFDDLVNKPLESYFRQGNKITFSAGIVIAHYKEPLSSVLQKAREVEKIAKNKAGRNAFAIAVQKSSGEVQQAAFKWEGNTWTIISDIIKGLKDDKFTNKYIINLTLTCQALFGIEMDEIEALRKGSKEEEAIYKGLEGEIGRLLSRARNDKRASMDDEKTMAGNVKTLWHSNSRERQGEKLALKQAANFVYALHIADFITRKTNSNA